MAVIRSYQPGDEVGILQLFSIVFHSEMPLEVWQWKYLRNGDPPPVFVAEEDGQIVCHFAAIRQRVTWQGREAIAWDSVDTMCHPRHQGKGLFRRAIQAFMQNLGEKQSLLIYGFPTDRHKRLGELLVGYEPVARVYKLQKTIGAAKRASVPIDVVFDVLPLNWDTYWRDLERHFALVTQRDRSYLAWRYLARPDRRYRLITIPATLSLAIVGIQPGRALLMEFLVAHDDERLAQCLLSGVEAVMREERVTVLEGWFPPFSWEKQFLCGPAGFHGEESEHWLECRLFERSVNATWLADHFYYSFGDFDVY